MKLLWCDTETTSTDRKNGAPIEVALIPEIHGEIMPHFHSYIRPHKGAKIDPEAEKIHGIPPEVYNNAPTGDIVCKKMINFMSEYECTFVLAGHNVSFDKDFLYHLFCRNQQYTAYVDLIRLNKEYCTLKRARARRKYIQSEKINLEALVKYFKIPHDGKFHGALFDTQMAIEVNKCLSGINVHNQDNLDINGKISYYQRKREFMSTKYIQFGKDGDFYLTKEAARNQDAYRFIMNELWEMYEDEI